MKQTGGHSGAGAPDQHWRDATRSALSLTSIALHPLPALPRPQIDGARSMPEVYADIRAALDAAVASKALRVAAA